MKVLIDTNVVMDVLLRREPFFADAQQVWSLAERGRIDGLVCAVTFPNIFYIVRKLHGATRAAAVLKMLRDSFTAATLDEGVTNQAIDAGFADFEDALQYFSAIRSDAQCIVSRNPGDFPKSGCPVLMPREFLEVYRFS